MHATQTLICLLNNPMSSTPFEHIGHDQTAAIQAIADMFQWHTINTIHYISGGFCHNTMLIPMQSTNTSEGANPKTCNTTFKGTNSTTTNITTTLISHPTWHLANTG
jgi:hypothetical protein